MIKRTLEFTFVCLILSMVYFAFSADNLRGKEFDGVFTLKSGEKVDCQDGYTTDLCCELWSEYQNGGRYDYQ